MRPLHRALGLALAPLVAAGSALPPPAHASTAVVASFLLDSPPPWQSPGEQETVGSWVKHSSPVVADLGRGGGLAILVGSSGGGLYALRYAGGRLSKIWSADLGTYLDSSPAVARLGDPSCPDVLIGGEAGGRPKTAGLHVVDCRGGSHRFWPAPMRNQPDHTGVFSTPAVGDIDGDGRPDVVYGSYNELVYAKSATGRDLPGWPHENYDTVWSSPALADLDGDGRREVVIGTDLGGGAAVLGCPKSARGTLSVLNGRGAFRPGFPLCLDTPVWSTPAVRDLNGDGDLDAVFGTNNYTEGGANVGAANVVRAVDLATGHELWRTPLASGARVFASPAVGDVGGGLAVAIGALGASGGAMYLLDARTGRIRWSRGIGSCGACEFMGSPVLADVDGDSVPDVVAAAQNGDLYAWTGWGALVDGTPVHPGHDYMFFNSPAVADLDGDGRNEVVLAGGLSAQSPRRGMVWVISTPGRGSGPWPFYKRTPDRMSAFGSGQAASEPPTATFAPPSTEPPRLAGRAGPTAALGAPASGPSPPSSIPPHDEGAAAAAPPPLRAGREARRRSQGGLEGAAAALTAALTLTVVFGRRRRRGLAGAATEG